MSDVLSGSQQEKHKQLMEEQAKQRYEEAMANKEKIEEKKKRQRDQMEQSKNLGAVAMGRGSTIMSDKLG